LINPTAAGFILGAELGVMVGAVFMFVRTIRRRPRDLE
jgi:hypothetical protein